MSFGDDEAENEEAEDFVSTKIRSWYVLRDDRSSLTLAHCNCTWRSHDASNDPRLSKETAAKGKAKSLEDLKAESRKQKLESQVPVFCLVVFSQPHIVDGRGRE